MTSTIESDKDITAIEKYIMAAIQEVIGAEEINISDKFVDLGGNSISLAIISGKIDQKYGIEVNRELFFDAEKSTIAHIAADVYQKVN